MKTIKGYSGMDCKILSEKEYGIESKLYLVSYGNNFYAYGTMRELNSLLFVPVNQCGTKEEISNQCKSKSELCRENIQDYNKRLAASNSEGWEILIQHEQKELNALNTFVNVLRKSTCMD